MEITPQYEKGYYSIGKVLYYHGEDFAENDHRVVMKDVCERLGWEWSLEQAEAYHAYTSKFLTEYRERMKDHVASGEELCEMRAAFGFGKKIMNVVTGKITQL